MPVIVTDHAGKALAYFYSEDGAAANHGKA